MAEAESSHRNDFEHPYAQMVINEMIRRGHDRDPMKREDYLSLVTWAMGPRTPSTALKASTLAAQLQVFAPLWSGCLMENVVTDRVEGRIKSLDKALGFTGRGRGGAKKSEMYKRLLEDRNHDLGLMIWQLTLLGASEQDASLLLAEYLQRNNGWNKTDYKIGFNLASTEPQGDARQRDEYDKCERVSNTLLKIYLAWRQQNPWTNYPIEIERLRIFAENDALLQLIFNQPQEE